MQKGFTLIELVITVAIVGLLASIAMPLAEMSVQRGKEQELRRSLREIRGAIDAWKRASDDGRIPPAMGKSGSPPTLTALADGVVDAKDPNGKRLRFLRRVPRDPFADPELPPDQGWATRSYESPPDAPRAGADVFDVRTKSEAKGLNGVPLSEW